MEARQVLELIRVNPPRGGRLQRVLLRTGRTDGGATTHQVLRGPFDTEAAAVAEGLRLRTDPRFARRGLRLHGLAVVIAPSYQAVPVQLREGFGHQKRSRPSEEHLRLGDLIVPRAYGFVSPAPRLPPLERSVARLTPFHPLLLLRDRTVCGRRGCLRWFEVLRRDAIRTVWVPAYLVAPHDRMRRYKVADGAGFTRARGALWRIGSARAGVRYQVMFRRGTLPPQRFVVSLADRQQPPFRLVVDRHGPGIYNAAGLVVVRLPLGRWVYRRPPLWRAPKGSRKHKGSREHKGSPKRE